MTDANPGHREIFERLCRQIAPFNKKSIALTPECSFVDDLDMDSLTVMDLVAAIEDEFDIILPLNLLPDLETIGHVVEAVDKILKGK